MLTTTYRSRKTYNQPLSLSKASNSLLFTTQAERIFRFSAPAPVPIGKRLEPSPSQTKSESTTATAELLLRKATERTGLTEYDVPSPRRGRSRPSSIRSSRKSSIRSVTRTRTQPPRRQSIETLRSRVSATSSASASRQSGRFDRLIVEEPASLINIPTELVHCIAQYLPRSSLLNLICVCRQLRAETIMLLYAKPQFTSTYRFAQFVTTVSHNRNLAELVRELDLSHFAKMPKNIGLAGWREWKYRSEPLYSLSSPQDNDPTKRSPPNHPLAHPLLLKYSTGGHDVPLGSLMHVLKACVRIRYPSQKRILPAPILIPFCRILNLDDLQITADYVILPSAPAPRWKPLLPQLHKPPVYRPTAFTNQLFISDVPKSNTWRGAEFRTLRYVEFVDAICLLEELEVLKLQRAVWVKRGFAEEIVARAGGTGGLRKVDFRGCGMNPLQVQWTRRWRAQGNESVRSLLIFD
jgi:hypothetical protein